MLHLQIRRIYQTRPWSSSPYEQIHAQKSEMRAQDCCLHYPFRKVSQNLATFKLAKPPILESTHPEEIVLALAMKGISRLFPHTGYCVKPAMQEQDLISRARKRAINLHPYDSTYVKVHSISMWVCVT
ncbi:hypothetical protein TB2_001202 [Malus domestica]